mmetsp:Transcript_1619/g.3700  ORF Transcript_1619/g.3700 Transcript_1619/m.3700 type:complete len:93 (+) Transcript_1619:1129-1407(+)
MTVFVNKPLPLSADLWSKKSTNSNKLHLIVHPTQVSLLAHSLFRFINLTKLARMSDSKYRETVIVKANDKIPTSTCVKAATVQTAPSASAPS